jgi:hypothetical protein
MKPSANREFKTFGRNAANAPTRAYTLSMLIYRPLGGLSRKGGYLKGKQGKKERNLVTKNNFQQRGPGFQGKTLTIG